MILVTVVSGKCRCDRRNQRGYRGAYGRLSDDVCLLRCTTHFGVVWRCGHLSTGGARLTASLTRGYRGKTPIGVFHTLYAKRAKRTKGLKELKELKRLKMAKRHPCHSFTTGYRSKTPIGVSLCCTPKRAKRLTRPKMAKRHPCRLSICGWRSADKIPKRICLNSKYSPFNFTGS